MLVTRDNLLLILIAFSVNAELAICFVVGYTIQTIY